MTELRHHRTPHWLNTRTRIGRLTIPQWIAVSLAFGIGGLVYWGLSTLHAPAGLGTAYLFGRIVIAGFVAGALAALFYGLADDRREPFIRQAVTYPFRRHAYAYLLSKQSSESQEETHARPTRAPAVPGYRAQLAATARCLAAWASGFCGLVCATEPLTQPQPRLLAAPQDTGRISAGGRAAPRAAAAVRRRGADGR